MPTETLHTDEFQIDGHLVAKLLAAQFPLWASLSLRRLVSAGTDNVIYRLGDNMLIRLPRTPEAASRVDKEHRWLPRLAPHLSLDIPTPIAKGAACSDYPVEWSIYPWFEGHVSNQESFVNDPRAVEQLAQFIRELHSIDPVNGPAPGAHNFFRGEPLVNRDAETRTAIGALRDTVDTVAVTAAWEQALGAPAYQGLPVWIHGDLLPGNLLLDEHGRFTAVIDFGGLAVGDPACDLLTAWSLFSRRSRVQFRCQLAVDDATWERGRGWALSVGLIALPYYHKSNPVFARTAARMISEVLLDHSCDLSG